MPYRQEWFDAPNDPSLPVHKDLPVGVEEKLYTWGIRKAAGRIANDEYKTFHFCRHCDGWIDGDANSFQVNTLNSYALAGRRGTEYHCRRCGERIGFMGMVS